MKAIIAICGTSVILVAAAHAATDPRKCDTTRSDAASYCAQTAATVALRRYMARLTGSGVWDNIIHCAPASSSFLAWSCPFGRNQGTATVTFRALSNGWHVRVAVKCADPSTMASRSCLS